MSSSWSGAKRGPVRIGSGVLMECDYVFVSIKGPPEVTVILHA
jgi:hypothetical protein